MKPLLFAVALGAPLALSAESPMFRGDPAHTGVYEAPSNPLRGKVAWSTQLVTWDDYQKLHAIDGIYVFPTTPAVVDHRIYTCVGPFLCTLDEAGKVLGRTRLGGSTLASPAVSGGLIYVPTDDGRLQAIAADNGSLRWSASIGTPTFCRQVDAWDVYHSSPVVTGDAVYVGSADGRIYAFGAAAGEERWHFQTGHVVRATPAVAAGRVFCGSFDGHVYALDAATGRELWRFDTDTAGAPWHAVQGSCAVAGDTVYVGSRSTFVYALDAATGALRWRHSCQGGWAPSSPAVRDGVAYFGQSDGDKATAVDASGKVVWCVDTPNETFGSPSLAGRVLYVPCNSNYNMQAKGALLALDIATGRRLWTLELPGSAWGSPVLYGDALYVTTSDGKILAVR